MPSIVHICFAGCARGDGMTLTLENGRLVAKDARGVAAAYEITSFTPGSVIITRTDYRPIQVRAMLTGRISEDGNTLVDGQAHWPDALNPFQMAWGDAIDMVPGDNHGKPAIPGCDALVTAPAKEALANGIHALEAKRMNTSICWLKAAQDNPMAQGVLAMIYFRGLNQVPVDLDQALRFAYKAADAHNSYGDIVIGVMYETGRGLEKDLAMAASWKEIAKADRIKEVQAEERAEQELQAQRQQQQARQQIQMQQGMSLLGLLIEAFAPGGDSSSSHDNAWYSESVDRESRRLNMSACGNPGMPPAACR